MKAHIELEQIRHGAYPHEHGQLRWGFDPGVVTCTCGARFRARIVPDPVERRP